MPKINLTFNEKWEIIIACDRKYDGLFYTAVKTTKIYCRPSCRSRKPKKNKMWHFTMIFMKQKKKLVFVLAKDVSQKLSTPQITTLPKM